MRLPAGVRDLDRRSNFYSNLLRESSAQSKPPRLYIDLFNTLVENRLQQTIPVDDGILLDIRAGQFHCLLSPKDDVQGCVKKLVKTDSFEKKARVRAAA